MRRRHSRMLLLLAAASLVAVACGANVPTKPEATAVLSKAIDRALAKTVPSSTYCMTVHPDYSFTTLSQPDLVEMFQNLNDKSTLYLMGLYDPSGKYTTPFPEKLLADAFKKAGKRLDMGKCCLHFKQLDDLELKSVAKVIGMSSPKQYLGYYKRVKKLK